MAKLIDGGRQVYEPPGQDDAAPEARVRVFLRAPTVYDRARHARAVARLGARMWPTPVLYARARAALAEIFAEGDAERAGLEAAIDLLAGGAPDPDDRAAAAAHEAAANDYARLEDQLVRHDDAYAALVADREFWLEVAPIEAFRLFAVGWENLDPPFRAGAEGVHEAALAALPPQTVALAGWHAIGLMRPTEAEAKNSASPSGSAPAPAPSPAASTPRPTAR